MGLTKFRIISIVFIAPIFLSLVNCALTTNYKEVGQSYLEQKDYETALVNFKKYAEEK